MAARQQHRHSFEKVYDANSALAALLLADRVWPVFLFPKISSDPSSHRCSCSHGRHRHRRGREGKEGSDQAQAIKQEHQLLSLEAHDCVNAIPDLSNMIRAVQGLVAQCEDLKLKYYEEMDKRKKLYNIVQETKDEVSSGQNANGRTTKKTLSLIESSCRRMIKVY
ncbi:hypothetical protein ZEAMMB73_Zm00001d018304 [Zea mays]|uniref:Uncharacterized protein n=1 Tax=Zea mays TaxID=4577 RepID=A0A1D6HMD3_MAIZE|nr:hypothetical protein ZEAMMB73_Zm00001d018304 [Zea mays]